MPGTAGDLADLGSGASRRAPTAGDFPMPGTAGDLADLGSGASRRAPTAGDLPMPGTAGDLADLGSSASRRAPTIPPPGGDANRAAFGRPIPGSLATIVRAFKSATTLRFHYTRGMADRILWHLNYYEHIVRGQAELDRITQYIANNPSRWSEDHRR
jgi:hypothetical protein